MAMSGSSRDESTPRPTVFVSEESRSIVDLAVAFTTIGSRLYESARLLDETHGDKRLVLLSRLASELSELRDAVMDAASAITAVRVGTL